MPQDEPKIINKTALIPIWCNLKVEFCTQWMLENPSMYVCRGCPYLKEEYQKKAIGRFGGR